ncbi:hypothetical protein T4D_14739 [Trichinella pseudospiralis]|uniref:Uncharacterized protein n=1 Tax=Trichinella pseudospiralis TaxID=6337 RepID=A0A0V1FP77_TRIPS|nr:hypothetical protein T4D_14739 [Trichinella pseudospiralis]
MHTSRYLIIYEVSFVINTQNGSAIYFQCSFETAYQIHPVFLYKVSKKDQSYKIFLASANDVCNYHVKILSDESVKEERCNLPMPWINNGKE